MYCPRIDCNGAPRAISKQSANQAGRRSRLPRRLQGKNVNRRYYKCSECNYSFYTIELLETDYELNYVERSDV